MPSHDPCPVVFREDDKINRPPCSLPSPYFNLITMHAEFGEIQSVRKREAKIGVNQQPDLQVKKALTASVPTCPHDPCPSALSALRPRAALARIVLQCCPAGS